MKLLKLLFIILGSISFIFLIIAAGLYYLLTRTPKLPAGVAPPAISEKAAQGLEEKLTSFNREIESAQKAGEKRPVSLKITEEEINSLIKRKLPEIEGKIPLKTQSIQVYFREGEIKVVSRLDLTGIKPTISADFDPQVLASGGSLKDALNDLDLGKLPLPGMVEERVKEALAKSDFKLDLPIKLEEIKAEGGVLFLRGVTKTSSDQSP